MLPRKWLGMVCMMDHGIHIGVEEQDRAWGRRKGGRERRGWFLRCRVCSKFIRSS